MIAATNVAPDIRQLLEDTHPHMDRDFQIGAAAGHAAIYRFDEANRDWIECSCGRWESIRFHDNKSGPYLPWKQHAQHKGVSFGKRDKAKSSQH